MKDANFIEMSAVCGKCHQPFEGKTQFFYDGEKYSEGIEFATLKCPHCGYEVPSGIPFFYYDKQINILYCVIETRQINTFEHQKKILEALLEQHLGNSDFSHQRNIRNAQRKFIERGLLYSKLEGFSNKSFLLGIRDFRITPPPNVVVDDEFCFVGQEKNLFLTKNDIAYDPNGLSSLQKNIIRQATENLNSEGFVVNLIEKDEERKPAVTCGLISIALTVGSVVIIPILVNVISDVITEFRQKHAGQKETEIKKNDEISISIYQDGTKNVYHFEGRADDVARVMKDCGLNSLNTISLKDTHTAVAVDNFIGDLLLPSSLGHQTFDQMAHEYQKVFSSDSAVEIMHDKASGECDETIVSYKASLLMENGDYKAAYWMMRPFVNQAKTIEFLYNFAFCLSHLDDSDDTIQDLYKTVIKKYLACLDLRDLEMFDGSQTQKDMDAVTDKFLAEGILVRDEDGELDNPPPKNEEEILHNVKMHNALWKHIRAMQEYDIEDLKKEAEMNSAEAMFSIQLEEVEGELQKLMEKASSNAMAFVAKGREYREQNGISEEQWLDMLLNDDLPELDDDSEENYSEEFDKLFREKIALETVLHKIQTDRDELRGNHKKV